ncbi:MAG: hypothetical protein ACJ8G7_05545 [Rhizobacter sp.]
MAEPFDALAAMRRLVEQVWSRLQQARAAPPDALSSSSGSSAARDSSSPSLDPLTAAAASRDEHHADAAPDVRASTFDARQLWLERVAHIPAEAWLGRTDTSPRPVRAGPPRVQRSPAAPTGGAARSSRQAGTPGDDPMPALQGVPRNQGPASSAPGTTWHAGHGASPPDVGQAPRHAMPASMPTYPRRAWPRASRLPPSTSAERQPDDIPITRLNRGRDEPPFTAAPSHPQPPREPQHGGRPRASVAISPLRAASHSPQPALPSRPEDSDAAVPSTAWTEENLSTLEPPPHRRQHPQAAAADVSPHRRPEMPATEPYPEAHTDRRSKPAHRAEHGPWPDLLSAARTDDRPSATSALARKTSVMRILDAPAQPSLPATLASPWPELPPWPPADDIDNHPVDRHALTARLHRLEREQRG